jgi:hypothetical protein
MLAGRSGSSLMAAMGKELGKHDPVKNHPLSAGKLPV